MNSTDKKYNDYAICREMLETSSVIRNLDTASADLFKDHLEGLQRILLTGEGSSRIFPAKRAIAENSRRPGPFTLFTEGATQALEYDLSGCAVIGASNSGRTKELVRLFKALRGKGAGIPLLGLTAHKDTPLAELADSTRVLDCGAEDAVAATKSVVEQALFYQLLFARVRGEDLTGLAEFADAFAEVLAMPVPAEWVKKLTAASRIYFAGRNDGVAEELTLKINEITRKPSVYLEGTYALHGIEEVMRSDEVLILIDPFEDELEGYRKHLEQGVGLSVFAVSSGQTPFPTFKIPRLDGFSEYLQLAAGWNLMIETGLAAGINLDKPERARKVGNTV